jgi:formylglycine-generating enzyme required for sulfatase activity
LSGAVPGGTFYRSYDGVSANYLSKTSPATVSPFRLDIYEVTVGRFRPFVNAVAAGWLPPAGSGKHTHANGGSGLANSAAPGTYETGWYPTWNPTLATTASAWTTNLQCLASHQTWTPAAGANENHPIDCVTWAEAYAFCIWDGGFLPSEAEWNYAAAGGGEQRAYPWSVPSTLTTIDCSYANYYGGGGGADYCVSPAVGSTLAVSSDSPKGDGKWGHTDLAGNAWEWTLDWSTVYYTPCSDCASLSSGSSRVIRGGGFASTAASELASFRGANIPTDRYSGYVGVRCARAP